MSGIHSQFSRRASAASAKRSRAVVALAVFAAAVASGLSRAENNPMIAEPTWGGEVRLRPGNGESEQVFRFLRDSDGKPFGDVLEIDSVTTPGHVIVKSEFFPAAPLRRYRFGAWVKARIGSDRYNLAVEWLDADRNSLGRVNSWMGILAGSDWEPHFAETIAPEAARSGRMWLEFGGNHKVHVKNAVVEVLPDRRADLSVDILAAPDSVVVRLENRGEIKTRNIRVRLELPKGLTTSDPLEFNAGDLSFEQSLTRTLAIAGTPEDAAAKIACVATATTDEEDRVEFRASTPAFVTVAKEIKATSADLPAPQLPDIPIQLGAYYFPVMLDWDRNGYGVRRVDYLTPKLGYYDEARPETADWHIYWAVEHGISFFVFDYYYNQGLLYLNDALEKGFLQSRFADRMKFCLDWCNEGHCTEFRPMSFSDRALEDFTRLCCERYFTRENYLKIDGKPVLLIHQWERIVNAHGGWKGCRFALDRMRETAREYGLPGIYFVAVHTNTPWLMNFKAGGFDCATAYAYGLRDIPLNHKDRTLEYTALIPRHRECFATAQRVAHEQGIDYIPSAWVGWDDEARTKENSVATIGNTPAAFRRMIEMLPDYVEPKTRLALFESWNEWGEGGHAEPEEHYGFGRVAAIRDVLSTKRGPYSIFVPSDAEKARLESHATHDTVNDDYHNRFARSLRLERGIRMEFGSYAELWFRPISQVRFAQIDEGLYRAESFGDDPILFGPPAMKLPASSVSVVKIRMSTTAGVKGQLYWNTEEDREWSDRRCIAFEVFPDNKFHEYAVPVGGHDEWRGSIWSFRLDPVDAPARFVIDWFDAMPSGSTSPSPTAPQPDN